MIRKFELLTDDQRHIILFDGVCNLCNGSVQLIIKLDKKKIFRFAPLQSEAGKFLLHSVGLPANHRDSFVYIQKDRFFLRSDALLNVAKTLGGLWRLAYVFILLPRGIRDLGYSVIAKNRYKWFGKKDECMAPTPELRKRFLQPPGANGHFTGYTNAKKKEN